MFEPLVLEECGALLLRGNEEASNMNTHQAVVAVTSTVCSLPHATQNMVRHHNSKLKVLLQQDDFLVVRLVLGEGVSQEIFDNDMVLLSKDDPNVSISACYGVRGCQWQSLQSLNFHWPATGREIVSCSRSYKKCHVKWQ